MKVLEVNTEKTWRGGERQTLYTLLGFREAGIEVTLLCRKGFPLAEAARKEGFPLIEVDGNLSVFSAVASHGSKFDLIHVQTAKAQTAAVFTKWLHRKPVVYTRRVDFVPKGASTRFKYKNTDHVVCISTPIEKILHAFGIKNTTVIYSVAVPKTLNRDRALTLVHNEVTSGKKIILTLAALVQHKDPLTLVKAIHLLSKKRNDFVLLHFGSGVLENEVRESIEKLNLTDQFKLMGFVPQAEDLFSIADIFVMSSEEEGLGSVVLDAFLYKIPVVSTNAGGLGEIVHNHGLLSSVHDPVGLAEHLNEVLDKPSDMKVYTDRAYQYVQEKHSVPYSTTAYVQLFQKILSSAPQRNNKKS